MSAYKKYKCNFVDKETLIGALEALDLPVEDYETPVSLEGFHGETRPQKANIIVRRKHLNKTFTGVSNDLGFIFDKSSGQYIMECSEYDTKMLMPQRIKQAYSLVGIQKLATEEGVEIDESTEYDMLRQREQPEVYMTLSKMM